jgi:hypothetical protein
MSWYYVSNNEKQGPVEQVQFEQLTKGLFSFVGGYWIGDRR